MKILFTPQQPRFTALLDYLAIPESQHQPLIDDLLHILYGRLFLDAVAAVSEAERVQIGQTGRSSGDASQLIAALFRSAGPVRTKELIQQHAAQLHQLIFATLVPPGLQDRHEIRELMTLPSFELTW